MVHWLGLALTDGGFVQMLCHVSSLSPIICDYVEFFLRRERGRFLQVVANGFYFGVVFSFKSLKRRCDLIRFQTSPMK